MWRALLVGFCCAASAVLALSAPDNNNATYCGRLHTGNRTLSTKVTLLWGTAPAHAASALLRAALLSAGARPGAIVLREDRDAARLCSVLRAVAERPRPGPREVVVVLATAWHPAAGECSWDAGAGSLRVQGAGAAPAAARLHARLAPPHAAARACLAALAAWPVYANASALRECGFLHDAPGIDETESAVVYVLEGEWEHAEKALRKDLNGVRLRFKIVTRAELAADVAESERSFLFLDAELWADAAGVHLAEPAPEAAPVSFRAADEYALRVHAPVLHSMFAHRGFEPRGADLRAVLERAASVSGGVQEAACMLAADSAHRPAAFARWRYDVGITAQYVAYVMLCDDERRYVEEYKFAVGAAGMHVDNSNHLDDLIIAINIIIVNCDEDDGLLLVLYEKEKIGVLPRIAFVVASANQVRRAAPFAELVGPPLLAYDVPPLPRNGQKPLRSAAGRADHLALAVRRLLAACGWRRLAVLSDATPLAETLVASLSLPDANLNLRAVHVTSKSESINETLQKCIQAEARVFLVNTGARAAAAVLAAALAHDLTPARGYAWIVREYDAADEATAALMPYMVSFQWRGPTQAPAPAGRPAAPAAVLAALETKWEGRAWPRNAAPIIDAILTLGEGYGRIARRLHELMDKPLDVLSSLWEQIQNKSISGILQDKKYDEYGVVAPLVYVDRWQAERRPRRVYTWRAGEPSGVQPDQACPRLSDGTSRCMSPSGDAFQPSCHDAAWIGATIALLAVGVALAVGVRRARAAIRRRDACIRAKVAASMLARRSRVFLALTPYLVERTALELREELGAGTFGRVRLGLLRTSDRDRPIIVAAKALWDDAPPAEETQFLKEACTLAMLDHEHVVRFKGVCVEDGPPLLLMEHAFFGDLLRYLQARRHLAEGAMPGGAVPGRDDAAGPEEAAYVSAEALTRLAYEAAAALAYVTARGLVHRDVRASNCLVDARRSLKLADFGLARETGTTDGEYAFRGRAMCPVLRMPPESLEYGVCSAASDVWAFGVLALELVTLGARPYGDASPSSVVRLVKAGGRPPLPRDASAETRALVRACCRREPAARPAAARLMAWLKARSRALCPALAAELGDVDADSGYGEPPARLDGADAALGNSGVTDSAHV